MNTSVTVSKSTLDKILNTLSSLQKDVAEVKEKVNNLEPIYGSKAWWEYSDNKALKSIKEAKGIKVKNKGELGNFFKTL
jgi:hypothetical protein